jgi:hypothetical protein
MWKGTISLGKDSFLERFSLGNILWNDSLGKILSKERFVM